MEGVSALQPVYREEQRFRQWWLRLAALAAALAALFAVVEQLLPGREAGNHPLTDIVLLIVCLLVGVGLPLLLWRARLITEVRSDGVYFRFVPFHRRFQKLPLESIVKYEPVSYRPIADYGGWGIRRGRDGYAYTVSGKRGVRFSLEDRKNILIGSDHPEEMVRAVERVRIS